MGRRFIESSHYRAIVPDNPDQLRTTAAGLITSESGFVAVDDRDGTLVGMIGILLFPHHLSGERIAGEVFWWVEPERRGGGVRLMKRAEAWAKDHGAVRMQMIAPSAPVGALYARLGYAPVEIAYERAL